MTATAADSLSGWKQKAISWWKQSGKPSAVCDVCNNRVSSGKGYVLTTSEVFASKQYMQHVETQARILGIDAQAELKNLRASNTPWLVDDNCIYMFNDNRK